MKIIILSCHFFILSPLLFFRPAAFCQEIFHNGGTGDCQECHTTPPALIGSDASSTCLRCHQGRAGTPLTNQHHIATDTASSPLCLQLPPGGDFCWLKKNYTWPVAEGMNFTLSSKGDNHGHNIVALDYGYGPDSNYAVAPGGTYPASSLSCISCHDPHGSYRRLEDGTIATTGPPIIASGSYTDSPDPETDKSVGVYRLLAGQGYHPKSSPEVPVFSSAPPVAIAPSRYNRAETSGDTRVVYGSGMTEWCQNCHPQLNSAYKHPVGSSAVFTSKIISNYNSYISSGAATGNYTSSYTSLVPYEIGSKDYTLVKTRAATLGSSGPAGGVNVMCLSCHRAHASGWDNMLRWNMNAEFITYEGAFPGIDNNSPAQLAQGRTAAETAKTFYDRLASDYARFQRNLCNKCHGRD